MLDRIIRYAKVGLASLVGVATLGVAAKKDSSLDLHLSYLGATPAYAAKDAPVTGIPFASLPGFPKQIDFLEGAGEVAVSDFVGDDGEPEIYATGDSRVYGWGVGGQSLNGDPDGTFVRINNDSAYLGVPAFGEISSGVRAMIIPSHMIHVIGPDGQELMGPLDLGTRSIAAPTIANLDGDGINIIGVSAHPVNKVHVYDIRHNGTILEAVARAPFPLGQWAQRSSSAVGNYDPSDPESEMLWGEVEQVQLVGADGVNVDPFPYVPTVWGTNGSPAMVDYDGNTWGIIGTGDGLLVSNRDGMLVGDGIFPESSVALLRTPGSVRAFLGSHESGLYGFELRGNSLSPLVGFPQLDGQEVKNNPLVGYFGDDGLAKVIVPVGTELYAWYAEGGMEGIPVAPFPIDLGSPIRQIALGHTNGADGLHAILAASAEGQVHALDLGLESRARDHPWPSFQYDDANTGNPDYRAPDVTPTLASDINGDGLVNIVDLILVARDFGTASTGPTDVNGDGIVNIVDLIMVARDFGMTAAPSLNTSNPNYRSALFEEAERQGQALLGDVKTMNEYGITPDNVTDALKMFGQLKEQYSAIIPAQAALGANYPNPFNPETWIPFALDRAGDVTVDIYDPRGTLVRRLDLGYQQAGQHFGRNSAAYWDGKNDAGERVASGTYFSTLNQGPTRRMTMRK